MNSNPFNHFVIVGAGIAGTTLALELWKRGCSIEVIDDGHETASSRVAAGILNPIVPKGVTLTWHANDLFPSVFAYYQNWINKWNVSTGTNQIFQYPFITIHKTADECKQWQKRYQHAIMKDWIEAAEIPEFTKTGLAANLLETPNGATLSKHCGRLDVAAFIQSAKAFLIEKGIIYIEEKLEYDGLGETAIKETILKKYPSQKDVGIIFCEGIKAINNPIFQGLFFDPTGGDILKVRIQGLPKETMFKRGLWLVPIGNDEWLAGSNFHKGSLTDIPNPEDAETLIAQLKHWIPYPIELQEHKRGVRPTVQNRRPYLGKSKHHDNCFIFNGLGSKGSSLCAWLAPMMADYICGVGELIEEVDIQRFKEETI